MNDTVRDLDKKIPADFKYENTRMTPLDRAFHEQVVRIAKGLLKLYEEWLKARNR